MSRAETEAVRFDLFVSFVPSGRLSDEIGRSRLHHP